MPSSTQRFSAPLTQAGRVHTLVIGSLAVIAVLWFGADATKNQQTGSPETLAQAMGEADANLAYEIESARSAIEELQVTAPRIVAPQLSFDQPALKMALGQPEQPRSYWLAADS